MTDNSSQSRVARGEFAILCLGGYLLSIAYGVTFLIPMLVVQRGGDEAMAGLIISAATISTVILVILSGHIADMLGSARSVAVSALFLAASGLGFALIPSAGTGLILMGFVLGMGWGTWYTIGPILVAAIMEPARRVKFLALLSGSMMTGIGTGPIIGRIATGMGLPLESAFLVAAVASLIGGAVFLWLHQRLIGTGKILPQLSRISLESAREVAGSPAIYSIVMVGVGGAIFGGLSSFQTSYASHYGFDYSLFFVGFMTVAILCRMLLAGYVVQKDPFHSLLILTGLTLISIVLFMTVTNNALAYLGASAVLGLGYGLTYSVITGLAANEAPEGRMPQSLLLFSLSYFVGVFGFPLVAGNLIVAAGIEAMLSVILALAVASSAIVVFRTVHRMATRKNMS